jgi:hypothetical protein
MNQDLDKLRRQFSLAWMKMGNCPRSHCVSPDCCYDFEHLRKQFGIEETGYSDNPPHKSFDVDRQRVSKVFVRRELSDWISSFQVFDDLRNSEAWLLMNPFDGFMETPRTISRVRRYLSWPTLFRLTEDEEMPPEGKLVIQRTFVQAFVDELFPNELLHELANDN